MTKTLFRRIVTRILTWQARMVLLRYKPKIIAITGSVGKTSTKDAIFTVLSKQLKVRKTQKSYNSEIGLPLTILGLRNGWGSTAIWIENVLRGFMLLIWTRQYPEWLILEIGAGKPNDIKSVAKWLHPDIVVITVFPDKPVHVEFFSSVEKIIEEKSSLAYALKPEGTLILNHDDEKVYALHEKANRKTVSFGFNENATYRASYPAYKYATEKDGGIPEGISFKLEYGGNTFPVMLPHMIGMHYVGQALSALAVASVIGCDMLTSITAIADYVTPPGRLSLIEGIKGSMLIDDTYNSSPVAMEAAIHVLEDIKAKRKIAVLGDMLELGKMTESAHREIGEKVSYVADILVVVGPRANFIAEGAKGKGFSERKIERFPDARTAAAFLEGFVKEGDMVLLKGSQSIRLERATEALMAHPEHKADILARQEKEWLKR